MAEDDLISFSIDDNARITNRLRNKHIITGVVTHVGARIVTIRNATSRRIYSRAWWNLEAHNNGQAQ